MIDGDLAYGRADWFEAMTESADRAQLEPLLAWGKQMLLDTSYTAGTPGDRAAQAHPATG